MSEHKKSFRHKALLDPRKQAPQTVEPVVAAPVDEVQTARPIPIPDAAFLRVMDTNPVVARAWQRLERQYKAFPYEEAAPETVVQAATDATQSASEWNISQGFMVDQLQVPAHPIFEALHQQPDKSKHAEDVPIKSELLRNGEPVVHTRVQGTPLPSTYKPDRTVYMFLSPHDDGSFTLECAWRTVENGAQLIKEHTIALAPDDEQLQERLQEMRTLIEGTTLYVWDVPMLFKAIGAMAHERFQPLYQWLRAKSLLDITKTMYQVGAEQMVFLTMDVLTRRFRLSGSLHERSRARNAIVLMLCHENIVREVMQLQEGKTVVPLDLRQAEREPVGG